MGENHAVQVTSDDDAATDPNALHDQAAGDHPERHAHASQAAYCWIGRPRRLLLTRQYCESVFVEELVADGLQLLDPAGRPLSIIGGPTGQARMRLRNGKYTAFWSCSRYRNDRTDCNITRPAIGNTAI